MAGHRRASLASFGARGGRTGGVPWLAGDDRARARDPRGEGGRSPRQVTPGCRRGHQRGRGGLQARHTSGEVADRYENHHHYGDHRDRTASPGVASRWSYPVTFTSRRADHWSLDADHSPVPCHQQDDQKQSASRPYKETGNLLDKCNGKHHRQHRRTWCGTKKLNQNILQPNGETNQLHHFNRYSSPCQFGGDNNLTSIHHKVISKPAIFTTTRVTIKNREFVCISNGDSSPGNLKENPSQYKPASRKGGNHFHGSSSSNKNVSRTHRIVEHPRRSDTKKGSNYGQWEGFGGQGLTGSSPEYGTVRIKRSNKSSPVSSQRWGAPERHRARLKDHRAHFKSNQPQPYNTSVGSAQQSPALSGVSSRVNKGTGRVLEYFNEAFDPGEEARYEYLPGEVRTSSLPHFATGRRSPHGELPAKTRSGHSAAQTGAHHSGRGGARHWRKKPLQNGSPTRRITPSDLRRILRLRSTIATSFLLTSIASDLDLMLHDLCRSIPYPASGRTEAERHLHGQHVERELELLEHYMDGLGQEEDAEEEDDEDGSAGSADREDSNASSELDFYSAGEEMDHSSGFYFASSEAESPPPLMPAPPPPIMPGEDPDSSHAYQRPIPLMERLVRTHALWFLPNIGRAGALHLLQNKEIGNFLVRESSRPDTMALSVRLRGKPRVEHYLVESTNRGLRLEGSFHYFSSIPVLIAYYCDHHRDELPVTLTLPEVILSATTHQELASLALLGQDFWTTAISPKKQPAHSPQSIIPYQSSANVAPHIPVTMTTTQVNVPGHHVTSLATQLNGISRVSTSTHTTSQKMTSSSCHKSEVIQRYISSSDPSNMGRCVSQSFHSKTQTFQNGMTPPPVTTTSQCLPITVHNGHDLNTSVHVRDGTSKRVVDGGAEIYDIPCSANNSPPIIRPIVTKASSSGPRRGYYGGSLEDRLSDYEDVWTNQSASSTFRPIQTARSVQELVAKSSNMDSEREHTGARFSAVNPGYITDSCSERDLTNSKHYQSSNVTSGGEQTRMIHRQARHTAGSTTPAKNFPQPQHHHHKIQQQKSQQQSTTTKLGIHRNEVVIGLQERKREPVVFTFDLKQPRAGSEPREPPSHLPPTPPVRRHRLERAHHRGQQQYLGGCSEQLAARFNVAHATSSSQQTARPEPEGDLGDPDKHSITLEPIASPRVLERRPHQRVSQAESYENANGIFQKTASMSRSHELLNAPSDVSQGYLTGQGAMGTGPGYTRSLSLPRHLQNLSLAEQEAHSSRMAVSNSGMTYSGSQEQQQKHATYASTQSTASEQHAPRISHSFNEHFFPAENQQETDGQPRSEERDTTPSPPVGRFPVYDNHHFGDQRTSVSDEESTVEDLIADVSPELTVTPLKPLTISNVSRMSEYDNVNGLLGAPSSRRTGAGSSVGTFYCQPWDSSLWDDLLNLGSTAHQPKAPPSWMGSAYAGGEADHLEKASSVGGYSSVFPGSLAESVPLNIDIGMDSQYDGQSEPMTCRSEAATSFEWQNDRDSAAEMTPQPPHLTPLDKALEDGEGDHAPEVPVKNYASLGTGEFDRFQDISDDEGVEDVGTGSFRDRLMPFLGSKRVNNLQRRGKRNAGVMMRDYIETMAQNKETTFGITIENFIKCTKEGSETNPYVVNRNVRQFMNGMKNYLIHHGEENLNAIIEDERSKLESDEFLNIDHIIEGALHKAVIKPLKHHIYRLFVEEYRRIGALENLSSNIRYAQTKTAHDLGIRDGIVPPEGAALEEIRVYLEKMQKSYSPLKKLENLLGATSAIYNSVQNPEQTGSRETIVSLGADDFLPLFVWVLVQCGMVSAEVEAEYIWGLLHPSLLAGEGGYYLTTLSSAVTALKNFKQSQMTADLSHEQPRLPMISDLQGFMKILIPDEIHDSIITKTLPVRPNMTARDVCTMIAHKFKITNPQDYGLYVLVDGEEERHGDQLSPQVTKADLICEGRECVFAYKRNNAKFVWPVTIST